jgi:Tripartite tricarboxylate transporter TctB family
VSRDGWSAAGLALLAIVYLVIARRYPLDTLATPGPGVMPLIAGVALLATAISMFIVARTARQARDVGGLSETGAAPTHPIESSPVRRSPLVLGAALVLYTAVLPRLGFIASSFALVVLASRLMGARGWWRPVALALGVAAAAHLLFARWLGVPLP